jgi:hypothetical protein
MRESDGSCDGYIGINSNNDIIYHNNNNNNQNDNQYYNGGRDIGTQITTISIISKTIIIMIEDIL